MNEPVAEPSTLEIDPRFSAPGAEPTPWSDASRLLETAEMYWITTVRSDGRPHTTPLIAVVVEGAPLFCTGPDEQKGVNLRANPQCLLATGSNTYATGLDVVVEGVARRITDSVELDAAAAAYLAKYGEEWRFEVVDDTFRHGGGEAWVFAIDIDKVLGFDRNERAAQTRWRFT